MSISLDKNGTYIVEYRLKNRITGEWKKYKKRGFKTKREAKIFEGEALKQKDGISKLVFKEIADEFIKTTNANQTTKDAKARTLELYFDYYESFIQDITKPQLMDWQQKIKEKKSSSLSNKVISFVKSVYKYANSIYDVPNYGLVLTTTKNNRKKSDMNVWTQEEFEKFISCETNPIYHGFFETLFWTGARRGEVIALEKKDFNEVEGYIDINKSMRDFKHGFNPTKNQFSVRKVSVDRKLNDELIGLKYRQGRFLFGDSTPLSVSNISREFNRLIKESGVKPINLHDLRHSHATILINSGMNIVAVSRRLGHSDINMTLKVYTHLLEKTNQEVVEFIDKIKDKKSKK